MQGVITQGTATSAQMDRPAAGKTGTTSSQRDIWFVGYVPQLSVAVWAGHDNNMPLSYGATGGGFVAPVWRDFMRQYLADEPSRTSAHPMSLTVPRAVVVVQLSSVLGSRASGQTSVAE